VNVEQEKLELKRKLQELEKAEKHDNEDSRLNIIIKRLGEKYLDFIDDNWENTKKVSKISDKPNLIFDLVEELLGEDYDEFISLTGGSMKKITDIITRIFRLKKT